MVANKTVKLPTAIPAKAATGRGLHWHTFKALCPPAQAALHYAPDTKRAKRAAAILALGGGTLTAAYAAANASTPGQTRSKFIRGMARKGLILISTPKAAPKAAKVKATPKAAAKATTVARKAARKQKAATHAAALAPAPLASKTS